MGCAAIHVLDDDVGDMTMNGEREACLQSGDDVDVPGWRGCWLILVFYIHAEGSLDDVLDASEVGLMDEACGLHCKGYHYFRRVKNPVVVIAGSLEVGGASGSLA